MSMCGWCIMLWKQTIRSICASSTWNDYAVPKRMPCTLPSSCLHRRVDGDGNGMARGRKRLPIQGPMMGGGFLDVPCMMMPPPHTMHHDPCSVRRIASMLLTFLLSFGSIRCLCIFLWTHQYLLVIWSFGLIASLMVLYSDFWMCAGYSYRDLDAPEDDITVIDYRSL